MKRLSLLTILLTLSLLFAGCANIKHREYVIVEFYFVEKANDGVVSKNWVTVLKDTENGSIRIRNGKFGAAVGDTLIASLN